MKKALIFAFFCALAVPGLAATNASEAMDERNDSLSDSYHVMSVAFSDIFQKSAGFMSGAHSFSPPMARRKFGFNVGLLAGATSTEIDKTVANKHQDSSQIAAFVKALPDRIPVPQTGVNLHFGLPSFFIFESFDAGLRYHGVSINTGEVLIDLSDVGVDLKGNVFEAGAVSPVTLALGLSADSYRGKIAFTKADILNETDAYGYSTAGSIKNNIEVESANQAYALRAILSRKLLFFNPYLGVAAQINNGSVKSRGYQTGTVTITGPGSPSTASSSATIEGSANTPIGALDMRLGGGFEMSFPFFYFSLNAEYGAISGGVGGTIQMGCQFR